MKALILDKNILDPKQAIASLKISEIPTPKPKHGQVLVKMEAAPCNPSDVLNLQGMYGAQKTLPATPGGEGCGTVVASGGGFQARRLVGKRVACGLQSDADGTWAEYFIADASTCIPLKGKLPAEQVASLIHPFTAVGLIDVLKSQGHRGFVHSAGLSPIGRMLLGLEKKESLKGIHLVRRFMQVSEMQALGAKHVLCLEDNRWREKLEELCTSLDIKAAIDAVGGDVTGSLVSALPRNGVVFLYGALALRPCADIAALDVIFKNKRLEGFYLGNWLKSKNVFQLISIGNRVQTLIRQKVFETQVRSKVSLEDAPGRLLQAMENMGAGQILICPSA